MNTTEIPRIAGADVLAAWFGSWPSFHDAEVVHLHLNRDGKSEILIHCFRGTSEVDERGHYVLANHALITFVFDKVTNLNLEGFNHQNVLSCLLVVEVKEGHELVVGDCYGLTGSISGKGLSVSFTSGLPDNSIYRT